MNNRKINTITLYNFLSTLVLSGINFLTIPIFTRMLGTVQYGFYSVFNAWLAIASCIMGLKLHSSFGTAIYTFKNSYKDYRKSIFELGMLVNILICVVFLIVYCVKGFWNVVGWSVVICFLLSALANYVVEFVQLSFIYEKKARVNFYISVGLAITSVILSFFLIRIGNLEDSYLLRAWGVAIPYGICAVALSGYVLLSGKNNKDRKAYWNYAVTIGTPIVFHALSQNVLTQSDRVMMEYFGCEPSIIGIYSFFYTFTNILAIVLNALNNSWVPFYYDDLSEKKYDQLKIKRRNYIELFTVLCCGFLLLSREVSYWFSGIEYSSGVNIVPFLVIATYLIFTYQFAVNFEFYNKKTKIIAIGTCLSGILNIILNAIMIPMWGMYGAALATAISYGMLVIVHFQICGRIKEMRFDFEFLPILVGFFIVVFMCIGFVFLKDYIILRWLCAFSLGNMEVYRIIRRKRIF